jgi:hypothetical protein
VAGIVDAIAAGVSRYSGAGWDWHRSMAEAAEKAINDWVRITANMARGAYDIHLPTSFRRNFDRPDERDLLPRYG